MRTCIQLAIFAWLALLGAAPAYSFDFPPWDTGHQSMEGEDGDPANDPGTNDGCNQCPCPGQGQSPVEAQNGNFSYSFQPLLLGSFGPALDLTLTYNSLGLRSSVFGQGWTHFYDSRIVETTDAARVYAICAKPNGKQDTYSRNPDGTYSSASPSNKEILRKLLDGSFVLRNRSGSELQYNNLGLLVAVVDRNGNRLTLQYDSSGFLTQIVDAAGRTILLTKGANGRVVSITDPTGRAFRFTYDASGFMSEYADPLGNTLRFSYVLGAPDPGASSGSAGGPGPIPKSRLATISDGRSNVLTRLAYDTAGRVQSWTDLQEAYTFTYDSANRRTTKRSSGGLTWVSVYNDNGNIVSVTDPTGRSETYALDADYNVTRLVDTLGRATSFSYDSFGNKITATDPAGGVSRFTWNTKYSRPLTAVDPRGATTTFAYDAKGNLTRLTNSSGGATNFEYDARGQLTRVVDQVGRTTRYEYDQFGNLVRATDPDGTMSEYSFDSLGRMTSSTDAEGRRTIFEYDAADRLVRSVNSAGGEIRRSYDQSNNLVSVVNPRGASVLYGYDQYNRLVSVVDAGGRTTTYTYDRRNNLVSKRDGRGIQITYGYDSLDRLTRRTKPEEAVSFAYDAFGNLISAADGDSSLAFAYDANNRVAEARTIATAAQPASTIRYSYDPNGNRTSMLDPAGGTFSYQYDSLSRLTNLTNPSGQSFAFEYDAASRRTAIHRSGSFRTSLSYDAANRLALMSGFGTSYAYAYDRVGNRISKTESAGTHLYQYDNLHRLVSALHPATTGIGPEIYSYDPVGNRTSSHRSNTHSSDLSNRLVSDDSFTYTYDAAGNLATKTERSTGRVTAYAYDSDNQLVSITFPGGSSASYRYDALGRRIQKVVGAETTRFVYDGTDILMEYVGLSSTFSARNTHGPYPDEILAVERGSAYFVEANEQGSVERLIDGSGAVVYSRQYDSYGAVTRESGPSLTDFGFQGHQVDRESGLVNMRARYYDPTTGRFLSEDPAYFSANGYAFALGNPVAYVDPSGLIPIDTVWDAGNIIYDLLFSPDDLPADVAALFVPYVPAGTTKICKTINKASKSAKRGETAATKAGREAHKKYNPGPTYQKEVRLPSGKRADAVDFDNKVVRELKPDNPRAIKKGEKQVEQYRQELEKELGGKWKGEVDTYKNK